RENFTTDGPEGSRNRTLTPSHLIFMDPISSLLAQLINPAQVARANPAIPADPSKWQSAIETARTGGSGGITIEGPGKAATSNGPGLAAEFVQAVDSKLKAGDSLRGDL